MFKLKRHLWVWFLCLNPLTWGDSTEFKSKLFKEGELVYSDDFEKEFRKEQWEIRQQTQWEVKNGFSLALPLRILSRADACQG